MLRCYLFTKLIRS